MTTSVAHFGSGVAQSVPWTLSILPFWEQIGANVSLLPAFPWRDKIRGKCVPGVFGVGESDSAIRLMWFVRHYGEILPCSWTNVGVVTGLIPSQIS